MPPPWIAVTQHIKQPALFIAYLLHWMGRRKSIKNCNRITYISRDILIPTCKISLTKSSLKHCGQHICARTQIVFSTGESGCQTKENPCEIIRVRCGEIMTKMESQRDHL